MHTKVWCSTQERTEVEKPLCVHGVILVHVVHLARKRVCTLKMMEGSVHTEQYFRDREKYLEKPFLSEQQENLAKNQAKSFDFSRGFKK